MFSALSLAQHYQSQGKEVLLVLDEINEHFVREMSIFQSTTLYYSPVSLIRNIHTATGRFAKGSITSLLVIDENKSDLQFNLEMSRFE